MNLQLLFQNLFDDATLSVSPALVATLPESNLKIARRDAVARSTGLSTQHVYGNLAEPGTISIAAIWDHNLTNAGTWRLRLYAGANRTGTLTYDSGTTYAAPLKTLGELNWGVDPLNVYWNLTGVTPHSLVTLATPAYAASFDLEWTDASNPAGYTQVGRVYLGAAFTPSVNFNWGSQLQWRDESSYLRSAAGSLFVDKASRYRAFSLTLDWLTETEASRMLDELALRGKETDVLVCAFPAATPGRRLQTTLAARLQDLPSVTGRFLNTYSATLNFLEI